MRWISFANVAFHAMKGAAPLWKNADSDTKISMTRLLYDQVFSSGNPHKTGYISSNALDAKREKKKTCNDHCLSPQFVARMIYDNPDVWLTDFEKFKNLFFLCCQTIVVTSKENTELSNLTSNKNGKLEIKVATHLKYEHCNITLFHPKKGIVKNPFLDILPDELIEYEKQYLTS